MISTQIRKVISYNSMLFFTMTAFTIFASYVVVVAEEGGQVLYNGIQLPSPWPPRLADFSADPVTPPYLLAPPKLIPIDTGRQLFVDDFLIEKTTLKRTFHLAEYYRENPIMKPDQPWEMAGKGPMAMPFSDGVWYDPIDHLFKMWYYAGHGGSATCYATSKDGIHWDKSKLDVVPDSNIVYKGGRDSGTVWLDHNTKDPAQRFKMMLYTGGKLLLFRSPEGIHWTKVTEGITKGDRTTFFYNPFRQRWVYSLRSGSKFGRSRHYWESTDFFSFSDQVWQKNEPAIWVTADSADPKREDLNTRPQLYNLDCVAYESLMIGLFSIWRGDYRGKPPTEKAKELFQLGRPKQNAICIGFSRDGFHWDRPDRRPFCPISEKMGEWNWGNMQSASDCCLVIGDKLYFYVSGRAGKSFPCNIIDGGGSTGLAILRRDGFASMDAGAEEGVLTTRSVRFGGKLLFVNLDAPQGQLQAEVLDEKDQTIQPFTRLNCTVVSGNNTLVLVNWIGAADLTALKGKPVKFRFYLRSGSLYAFWVSPDASGASYGYVAGGGPGFPGPIDTVGRVALEAR
ncbi:MAG: hypothetical protein PHR77_17345 [Kiritimatiellae bacterium]|nr:hypothetical protein [Kiritimatiellia bacterium]MDD5522752.1 hypothetical protein [Kiritimatiellia bacterium]